MANVTVQKVEKADIKALPIFEEIEKRLEGVRQRAFDLFQKRGCEIGHAVEDWLKAEHEVMGWPAAEMTEMDGKYKVGLTLPGFDAKQVQVTATPSEIIVHAQYKPEKKEEGKVLWSEFGTNDVYRCFETPQPIDVDKIHATLDKGMLHVTAAKAPASKPKPIEVKAA
jgi:HSP20 family molecular chaperone IbpA